MNRKNMMLLMSGAMAVASEIHNEFFNSPEAPRVKDTRRDCPDTTNIKVADSRQLREFSVRGHKIMAYSRKDAITRLKHQKKI